MRHAEFDFDEIEIVNNRPMNIWLYAKWRKYLDPDAPEEEHIADAEVEARQVPSPFRRQKKASYQYGHS
jgi:hypothetical protein